jgi:hypothetical protein
MPNPRGLVGSADIPTLFAPTQGRGGQIKSSAPVRDVGWHALDVRVQERDGLNLVVQVDSHESRIEMMPAMRSLSRLTNAQSVATRRIAESATSAAPRISTYASSSPTELMRSQR